MHVLCIVNGSAHSYIIILIIIIIITLSLLLSVEYTFVYLFSLQVHIYMTYSPDRNPLTDSTLTVYLSLPPSLSLA